MATFILLLVIVLSDIYWPLAIFQHGSLLHLFVNLFAIATFGFLVERWWGSIHVWGLVIGGALFGQVFDMAHVIGISGGVFALVTAYAHQWPEKRIFNVPARIVVAVFAVSELVQLLFGWAPNVAHATHLLGIIFGVLYVQMFNLRRAI